MPVYYTCWVWHCSAVEKYRKGLERSWARTLQYTLLFLNCHCNWKIKKSFWSGLIHCVGWEIGTILFPNFAEVRFFLLTANPFRKEIFHLPSDAYLYFLFDTNERSWIVEILRKLITKRTSLVPIPFKASVEKYFIHRCQVFSLKFEQLKLSTLNWGSARSKLMRLRLVGRYFVQKLYSMYYFTVQWGVSFYQLYET